MRNLPSNEQENAAVVLKLQKKFFELQNDIAKFRCCVRKKSP